MLKSLGLVGKLVTGGFLVVALISGIAWLRSDAASDRETQLERDAAESRVDTLHESHQRRNDVDALDDDTLLNRLLERLHVAD